MNRYSPYLQAVDPSRAAIPVPLTQLCSAVALLLAMEPGAKLVQQAVQRRALSGHAPAPWQELMVSGEALLHQAESWLYGRAPAQNRPQQIAQRHEILRSYSARVLYAMALKTCLRGVTIRNPLDPFAVWYLFCGDGDVPDGIEARPYCSWRGRATLESIIAAADSPEECALGLAEDTVEAMVDLEQSGAFSR